jgi:uncharacterized membrane protein YbhN (UPF0104 family)
MLSKKTIGFLLKIGIVAFALFFLYEQLTAKSSVEQFNGADFLEQVKGHYGVLLIIVLMMFLNWFLEALKWRFLIRKIEDVSVVRSVRAIFSGITVSAFTPNRVGEYGGRVFCLQKADRIQAVLITVIGSMAQLLTTIMFGSIGLLFLPSYKSEFSLFFDNVSFAFPVFAFILIVLNTLLILLFLNASVLSSVLSTIPFLKKFKKYNSVFSFYSFEELLKVLGYSIARYFVFTTQFFILLQLFDVSIAYTDAFILIATMLFVISVIPTIAITEIGVRSSVALFLFGLVSSNTIGILSATFLLWVINLLLPSLIGVIFIFSLKFFRK